MGGLTALMLAHHEPDRVLSFVDIEGNLAPEDCFLSRQTLTRPSADAETFVADFVERTRRSPEYASARYASGGQAQGAPGCRVRHLPLDGRALRPRRPAREVPRPPLPADVHVRPANATLSYLRTLAANGVEIAEIPQSGPWPMYSNPVATWERIDRFHARHAPG
jgi:pimeloyl-ACP methyl ester carboxylesterase